MAPLWPGERGERGGEEGDPPPGPGVWWGPEGTTKRTPKTNPENEDDPHANPNRNPNLEGGIGSGYRVRVVFGS